MQKTLESKIARLFSMSDETWKKHANPWSVWTRVTALPALVVAVWSRVWIGHWAWGMTVTMPNQANPAYAINRAADLQRYMAEIGVKNESRCEKACLRRIGKSI